MLIFFTEVIKFYWLMLLLYPGELYRLLGASSYTRWTYMHIFRHIFLSNYSWQRSDIWSQASYRYPISWELFLDPSDSYFLFANFVDFYTHWTYMLIFRRIFLSNYWWQESDIWSQASYRYAILWEAFLDPSDSYFLLAEERGYHKWALAHSSSCLYIVEFVYNEVQGTLSYFVIGIVRYKRNNVELPPLLKNYVFQKNYFKWCVTVLFALFCYFLT